MNDYMERMRQAEAKRLQDEQDRLAREEAERKKQRRLIVKAVVAGLVGVLGIGTFASSCTTIGAGEVGVVRRFGEIQPEVLTEGLSFVAPFVDNVRSESVRVRIAEFETSTASRDLVEIITTFAVNYQVDPARVTDLHRNVGTDFEAVVLYPAIQETMKAVTAEFTAEELVTRRSEVSAAASAYLHERVAGHGISITTINITDLSFSREFAQAIEQRQIAEQRVLTARQELDEARVAAEQEVVRAQAEADAMAILNAEITPELLQRMWIEQWDGVMPQVTTDTGMPQLMLPIEVTP